MRTLTPDQVVLARQLMAQARQRGVPPIVALTTAWHQTGFKPPPATATPQVARRLASYSAAGQRHPIPFRQLATVSPQQQRANMMPRRGQKRLYTLPKLPMRAPGAVYNPVIELRRQLLQGGPR